MKYPLCWSNHTQLLFLPLFSLLLPFFLARIVAHLPLVSSLVPWFPCLPLRIEPGGREEIGPTGNTWHLCLQLVALEPESCLQRLRSLPHRFVHSPGVPASHCQGLKAQILLSFLSHYPPHLCQFIPSTVSSPRRQTRIQKPVLMNTVWFFFQKRLIMRVPCFLRKVHAKLCKIPHMMDE